MKHAISWFEIPVTDMARARKFYETIFEIGLIPVEMPGLQMCMFPIEDPMSGIGGALCKTDDGFHKPSATDGPLIYLNGNPDLQVILDRVEAAGGKIHLAKMQITEEYGYMGIFVDSEGNRIGLHNV